MATAPPPVGEAELTVAPCVPKEELRSPKLRVSSSLGLDLGAKVATQTLCETPNRFVRALLLGITNSVMD